ncbi:MAG: serine/threonine-protein kinase [Acidimicrobiales bacterium]
MPEIRVDEHLGRIYGDRYRLVAPVGTGASARVYMAEDQALRRRVAVKTLHPGLVSDEQFRRRFLAEAQVAAQVSHPHLLAVYDWGEHDTEAYLVTELLSGGSLRDMLDAGHRLSESQALLVGLHAAQGLDAAHERGLVHRDIKPANLLFDEKGRVRIGDFGIARAVAEATWTEPEGALIGTARYAAPEQAVTGEVDGRADVYSLALTLIEAVTGDVPLVSSTPIATMVLRQKSDVVVPDSFGPLRDALTAAGRADRSQRPSASEFAAMLRRAASSLPRPEPLALRSGSSTTEAPPPVASFDAETEVIDLSGQVHETSTERDTDVYDLPRQRRRWPFVLLVLLAVVGVAGYFGYDYYDKEIRIPTHGRKLR